MLRPALALALTASAALGLAACSDGAEPPETAIGATAPATGFVRSPYLTRVTRTEARLRWIAPAGARVRLTASAPDGTTVRAQRGHLRDLAPDTGYDWVATVDGMPAARGRFRTAPRDLARPVDLIAFGDYGAGNDSSRAVARLAAAQDAALLITTGDNAFPVTAPQIFDSHIFGPLAPVLARMPNYGTMGDHDVVFDPARRALAEAFEWPGGGERYALTYGPVQVVALGLEADASDVSFARRALARPGPRARLVVTHRPIHAGNPLLPVLARADVTAVIAGHLHAYERRSLAQVPGVPFLTVGTGGAPRSGPRHTPRSDDAAVHVAEFGLLRLRLHGDRATYEFVDTAGAVRDRFGAPVTP